MEKISEKDIEIAKTIYEEMQKHHEKFCNHKCFTWYDVYVFLYKKPFIERKGTKVIVKYNDKTLEFGNTSFDHFIDCLNTIKDLYNPYYELYYELLFNYIKSIFQQAFNTPF
ncbi:MAG: hypothetical protein QW682_08005 [Nitrososphaerota archaeon]